MSGLIKSPLHLSVVENLYTEILTQGARYFYFIGKTDKWNADDGIWTTVGTGPSAVTIRSAPPPSDTPKYELDVRNAIVTYKHVKPSDVSYIVPRYTWVSGSVYDMYDDAYDTTNPAYSGATTLEGAQYYVVNELNYVYKCISNYFNAPSTVEPTGTSVDEFTTADGYIWKFMYAIPTSTQNKFMTAYHMPITTSLTNRFYENGSISRVTVVEPGSGYTDYTYLTVTGDGFLENNPYKIASTCVVETAGAGYTPSSSLVTGTTWLAGTGTIHAVDHGLANGDLITIRGTTPYQWDGDYTVVQTQTPIVSTSYVWTTYAITNITWAAGTATVSSAGHPFVNSDTVVISGVNPSTYDGTYTVSNVVAGVSYDISIATDPGAYVSGGSAVLSTYTGVLTVTATAHPFINGDKVVIRGVTPYTYDGTYTVTNALTNTFDVSITFDIGAYVSGGVVTLADYFDVAIAVDPTAWVSGGTVTKRIMTYSTPIWGAYPTIITGYAAIDVAGAITSITNDVQAGPGSSITYPYAYTYDWLPTQTYVLNDIILYNDQWYKVTVAGTTTAYPPTHLSGVVLNGTCELTWWGSRIYGYGYDQSATITLAPPFIHDFDWAATTAYTQGDIIRANTNFYRVVNSGTTNATLPAFTSGTSTAYGTCELAFLGTSATARVVSSKTEAILQPVLAGGQFIGVNVIDGGVGYTIATIGTVDSPVNTSAILEADLSIGTIDSLQANVELNAMNHIGSISYIKVETGGAGYILSSTNVTVSGNGINAAATPVIVNGSVKEILLTNHGTGYSGDVAVTITSTGSGTGATARAILAPPNGHGSNAVREFAASKLMFYSVLSDERLHGVKNTNDYRQFGVMKNPLKYGQVSRFALSTGTPCWLVTADAAVSTTNFLQDDIVAQGADLYRIVEISGTSVVLLPLSNTTPQLSAFTNQETARYGNTFNAIGVTSPEVDKMSGDMLFIDNKMAFVATANQMITFRTTIGF